MNDKEYLERSKRRNRTNLWIGIGAIILIVLLLVWLTIADLWGDTDVAAMIPTGGVMLNL